MIVRQTTLDRSKCTDINYVALEAFRIDLLAVQLNESPVLREAFVASTDGNRRGVHDVPKDALVLCTPELRDLTAKHVQGPYRLLRLRQLEFNRLPRASYHGILALDGFSQTLKLGFVVVDHEGLVPDLAHDGHEYVLVGLAAKENDLATRGAVSFADVELVTIFARRENHVASSKEEDPIAFAAFTEIKSLRRSRVHQYPRSEGRLWEQFGDQARE